MNSIFHRVSIRKYKVRPVEREKIINASLKVSHLGLKR